MVAFAASGSLYETPYPITFGDNSMPIIGLGRFGCVFKSGEDRVVKKPKTYPEVNDPDIACINEANVICFRNEADVYKQLGRHKGILQYFRISDYSIELAFANQGDLFTYMRENSVPTEAIRFEWIRLLADTFAYVHSCRVVVEDISLKNILVHNNCLKLVDFGNSFLLPVDTDMEQFCVQGITPELEIFHLGCVFYSIVVWSEFEYNCFEHNRLPKPDQLPNTDGIPGEVIIKKCWTGGYASMENLKKNVEAVLGS